MSEKIQRVPRGLLELLSIHGGLSTKMLRDDVGGVLEQLQFYGLMQRQTLEVQNAALTEANQVGLVTGPAAVSAATRSWAVLFGASVHVLKTATQTALDVSLSITRGGGAALFVANKVFTPFGAGETGTSSFGWFAPYPLLMPPTWDVNALLGILAGDANANVTLRAEVGVL